MKKICVVTGTRADYGLLRPLIKLVDAENDLQLQLIASAAHLSPEFGFTYQQIEADGFSIDARVEMLLASDSSASIARSVGLGTLGFADAFERLQPHLVVILGDRFEALAAAQSALLSGIPIAHIHGGEVTEGAIDEMLRHAITKMSHLHFVSHDSYHQRVIQMGEQPESVFVTGAPGLDNLRDISMLSRRELANSLETDLRDPFYLVTYHPETLREEASGVSELTPLLNALAQKPEVDLLITYPNADQGGRHLICELERFSREQGDRVKLVKNLGQQRYLSALNLASMVIGNSSSGIIEAPSFKVATVNIGERQSGRLRADSIIDCDNQTDAILIAIEQAQSQAFKKQLQETLNPFGDGHASQRMLKILRRTDFNCLKKKAFNDL